MLTSWKNREIAENFTAVQKIINRTEYYKFCTSIACLKLNSFDKSADSACFRVIAKKKKRSVHLYQFFSP